MRRLPLLLSLVLVLFPAVLSAAPTTELSVPRDGVIEGRPGNDPVRDGGAGFLVYPGYRLETVDGDFAFAFPVGGSALGRDWAGNTMQWQLANSYSVVPVLVWMQNRHPSAQRWHVDIYSAHPYAREELQSYSGESAEENLDRQLAVFSGDYLVPPGSTMSYVLTPRLVPEVPPLGIVHLKIVASLNGNPIHLPPERTDLELIVLDPANLYFLNLDGQPGQLDWLNADPGSYRALAFNDRHQLDPSILSTKLVGIPIARAVFTGAPLAARDFAFVLADAQRLKDWPVEEQQALVSYMLGGGRLCLYNMQEARLGFLPGRDSPVGRGFLLAESGDYYAARQHMLNWTEGELEEFLLLAGGSVDGYSMPMQGGASTFSSHGVKIDDAYGPDPISGSLPSRRPGYLHPVWLYREMCSDNAVEPWDWPDFQMRGGQTQNAALVLPTREDETAAARNPSQQALLDTAVPARPQPLSLSLVLLLLVLSMLLLPRLPRRRLLSAVLLLAGILLTVWSLQRPLNFRPARLRLIDRDMRAAEAVSRRLNVLLSSSSGHSTLEMPADALIRRVAWSPPGSFRQERGRADSFFSGQGPADSLGLFVDSVVSDPPDFPVDVQLQGRAGHYGLRVDTSGLAPGQVCVLQSPLGFQLLPASSEAVHVQLNISELPVHPGLERIRSYVRLHALPAGQGDPELNMSSLLDSLRQAVSGDNPQQLSEVCWSSLLRQPTGLFGMNQAQLVLSVVDNEARDADGNAREITVQRLCMPLIGAGDG